ncbi:hypothetical protein GCM10007913_40110 [Devosia yakushimensis]|uniref:DUF4435 domain-containing protein n=1 Tax=Devosia yakushimensis TaxID=470028 RepID=A0ABQ5UJ18_9HYPH|nr:hypothetical protein [Devosia yakushimensis]GLQ12079.1 hypothetical protein GCM10007913_40110 [Devosia yakushimensis]
MPSLSELRDTTALRHRYVKKVVVYVESEADANLFRTIVGPGFNEHIVFEPPPEGGTGCGPARAYVEKYRPDDPNVYALLDGEASVPESEGFKSFVKSDGAIFSLDQSDGLLYLADHEAENILLRQADIVAYIVDQTTLADLGKRKPEEIVRKVSEIVDRQFLGALCKYASYLLHAEGKISGVLGGTHAQDARDEDTQRLLEERVASGNCDWQTFKDELDRVRDHIILHMESMDETGKTTTKWRLADGKIALRQMRATYGIAPTWEVPLAKSVASSDYARKFREDLFRFTKIPVAA